jgi:hypothetical protein
MCFDSLLAHDVKDHSHLPSTAAMAPLSHTVTSARTQLGMAKECTFRWYENLSLLINVGLLVQRSLLNFVSI